MQEIVFEMINLEVKSKKFNVAKDAVSGIRYSFKFGQFICEEIIEKSIKLLASKCEFKWYKEFGESGIKIKFED